MTTAVAKFRGWLARWKGNSTSNPWDREFYAVAWGLIAIVVILIWDDSKDDQRCYATENRIATIEARLAESEGR